MPAFRPVGHDDRLSLVEHLDELRTRIIFSLLAFVVAFSVCYWQNDRVLHIVNKPLDKAHRVDCQGGKKADDALERSGCFDEAVGKYLKQSVPSLATSARTLDRLSQEKGLSASARAQAAAAAKSTRAQALSAAQAAKLTPKASTGRQPVTLGVTEPFLTTITVSAYAALLVALPFILWQLYAFILPAFSAAEKRVALPLMALVPFLFIAGVVFGYFLALPRAVNFLQNYNDGAFDILVQAKDYYRFSTLLLAGMGVLFQIPVGVLAIVRLRIVTIKQLRAWRGYALILFAVIAAVVTPTPDPFTMLIAMAPLVVLYEISLILGRIFEPKGEPRFGFLEFGDDDDDEDSDDERGDTDDEAAGRSSGAVTHVPNDLD
ncbi:MAG TPA: twin-arginine translocase subunit TatC [Baekduia sp.]|uniref:twin-arginine translocase subunit TatC n=1 Tax=Baekduia sp. TaxID=2600305 RepID=UPI002D78EDDD|nr:twin-arginine translocase subunit TatC [Baekduia sp.]HET6508780.1 twin-arginine translocase subunit TatC [Baekduia sp.]